METAQDLISRFERQSETLDDAAGIKAAETPPDDDDEKNKNKGSKQEAEKNDEEVKEDEVEPVTEEQKDRAAQVVDTLTANGSLR